jgi:hypothetical protein
MTSLPVAHQALGPIETPRISPPNAAMFTTPTLVGWWKCCKKGCEREINKELHGEEKCPDCGQQKCDNCIDPFHRPNSFDDLILA